MLYSRVADWPYGSANRTVIGNDPLVVGVPVMAPLDVSASPGGSTPGARCQVPGRLSVVCSWTWYAVPIRAAGRATAVVMTGGFALMVKAKLRLTERGTKSMNRRVTRLVPARVG